MDLRAILKEQGYTDEQIKAITDAMSANKLYVTSVEDPEAAIKKLQEEKEQLEEAAKQQEPDATAAEEIRKLQETVRQGKINAQLILALTKANASDVDYMMYQAEKTGEIKKLQVGEDGKVTGVDELVADLKKSHAAQFTDPQTRTEPLIRTGIKKLESGTDDEAAPQSLEEAIAQEYSGDEK
ncbi:MAG: phage scaffolding protein [Lachnospiraceae bacterium]|nr:phage scaffolding protein [Lachnospiraceae bacterium]